MSEADMNGERENSAVDREIGSLAMEAILFEAAATPKPGLVDRLNCGAHRDMDFFTFLSSASVLQPFLQGMARAGMRTWGQDPQGMWPELRALGREAEARMFEATGGVNTHKGEIFSLGLLCGCAGWLAGEGVPRAEAVMSLAGRLCQGLCASSFSHLKEKDESALTHGERVYLRYGCAGARGEAERGYATVREVSLPALRGLMERGSPVNDAMAQTLLHLIAAAADTNIIARRGMEAAEYAQKRAREALVLGGVLTGEGLENVLEMDRDFIARNISPGGCSDLLAVTWFLLALEGTKI